MQVQCQQSRISKACWLCSHGRSLLQNHWWGKFFKLKTNFSTNYHFLDHLLSLGLFDLFRKAAISQMQKKFRSSCGLNNENELFRSERSESPETDNPYLAEISKSLTQSTALQKHYIFLFSIELHSYLPISRKTLVSTFRKKKRVFKGQCQIYENFIRTTQFSKRFELYEV